MAGKDLQAFLNKLDKELEKKSKYYRKYTSDIKPHTFYLSRQGLNSQILFQMERDGVNINKNDIDPIISEYFKNLKTAFTGPLYGVTIHHKKITNVSFYVTFSPAEDHKHYFTHTDTFILLKSIMFISKTTFNRKMKKLYKNQGANFNPNAFLDVGHGDKSAVWDNRVSDQLLSFGEAPPGYLNIKEVAAIFSLAKIDKEGVVEASLESASKNRSHGAGLKKDKVVLQGLIADALQKLSVIDLDGSDSLLKRKKKKLRQSVLKPFMKSKNATTVAKDLEYENSSSSPTKLGIARTLNAKRTKTKKAAKAKARRKTHIESPASSMLQMIVLINKKLPDTVKKNMQPPALENRTGRFAESAKVTEIVQTKKGFPSVGYTYQRDPYQVFETNSRGPWSSPQRDPRTLIDKSIREIAAQMTIGRLYTRRV